MPGDTLQGYLAKNKTTGISQLTSQYSATGWTMNGTSISDTHKIIALNLSLHHLRSARGLAPIYNSSSQTINPRFIHRWYPAIHLYVTRNRVCRTISVGIEKPFELIPIKYPVLRAIQIRTVLVAISAVLDKI